LRRLVRRLCQPRLAGETGVEIVAVIDASAARHCAGKPVVADLAAASALREGSLDAVVVTDTRLPQERFEAMLAAATRHGMPPERILAPELLHISLPGKRNGRGATR
jgi:hypothetical protein